MRLSMWVLAKELKKFQITAELHEPSLTVERARIAKPDSPHSNQDESTAWITMDDSCGCVLVTCRADKIKVDCSSVNEVSELLQGTFEKYSTWYESMISCAMDGTLEEIVSPSAEILGVRLTAVNMNTLSIVCSAEPDDYSGVGVLASAMQNDHLSLPVLSDIERSADCVFASCNYRLYHVGAEPFALLPLQSEYGYYLLIAEGRKCTPGILQLCTYLTQVIHVWGRLHPAEETDSMLRQMISGQAFLPEKAWQYLGWFGIQQSKLYVLYDMNMADNTSTPAAAIAAWLNQQPHEGMVHAWLCPDTTQEILLMFSGTVEEKLQWDRALTGYLAELPVICGMSGGDEVIAHFSIHYRCARLAAQLGFDSSDKIKTYESAFLNILKMLCEKEHLQTTLPALRFLQETDRKTGSNYYHTLRTYLRNQQNQTLTAKELFISRSGLQHRLRDIQELLSFDLKKREYQLVLELSFYLSEQEQSENENP